MTIKQKLFTKTYKETGNATEAAMQAYNVKSRDVARRIGTENLSKPVIKSQLAEWNEMIESTLKSAIVDFGTAEKATDRALAVDTAKWMHDKIHGKATQRTESVSASFISHTSDKAKQYNLDV